MSELRADDPRQLGSYRLTRRLGQGGQGVVYLGHSPQGSQVAVKLLHASLSGDADVRRRFLGEVEAVRRVAAFCTAQLLDADLDGDRPYLVSEYVEGPSLREHVIAQGPRRGGSLDRLAIGTATALGAIHRAGVVHRDFKPGNVLLGIDGPRVIDFGVSRLVDTATTTSHLPMGTPAYMAPERMKGEPAGPPADMWAWGLTVVYTATGRNAYTADTHQEVLARVLYGKPDLGALGGTLREIVQACLATDPGERPDAEEVLRLLLGQSVGGADALLSTGAMAAVEGPARETDAPEEGGSEEGDSTESDSAEGGSEAGKAGRGGAKGRGKGGGGLRSLTARPGAVLGLGAAEAEAGVITDPDPTTSFPAITAPQLAARAKRDAEAAAATTPDDTTIPDAATTPDDTTTPDAAPGVATTPGPRPVWRRVRGWQVAVLVAGLLMGVGGFVFWLRSAQGPGLEGTWSGSAEHFSARRVFPIEVRLGGDGGGLMRWGADLHCTGRLGRVGSGMVFVLDQVQGAECYPGTLRMFPTADVDQMAIKVTRDGKDEVTYSGKVVRTS
ncbi:serine/threonine-protein kinase [Nonomuraea sp. KM90]|uniref:serine/threonine-protein kinase n=1 Tax=Nonomuraea sp. KM90 TaxID=3457428 RepID=UPI003FCE55E7